MIQSTQTKKGFDPHADQESRAEADLARLVYKQGLRLSTQAEATRDSDNRQNQEGRC